VGLEYKCCKAQSHRNTLISDVMEVFSLGQANLVKQPLKCVMYKTLNLCKRTFRSAVKKLKWKSLHYNMAILI
jgi:hypothetical protein